MSRRKIKAGTQNLAVPIFVQDTSSTTGGGLGALVYNTSGLAARYRRQGQSSWTSITLASMTLGTWVSGGFVSAGGVTGKYEFCPPNAAIAAGAEWVEFELYGAANMLPVLLEFELDTINYQASAGKVPATIAAGDVATDAIDAAALKADAVTKIQTGLATPTNITAGTITTVSGNVNGKVLGGGSGTITGTGVRADNRDGDAIPTAAQNAAAIDTATLATDIAAELQGAGVTYTVVSPIAEDGDSMTIVQGDDYADADSRAISVTITGTQPAYTGATPRLRMSMVSYDATTGEDATTVVTVTGSVVTATGATRVVKFEPTAADTSQLAAGVGTWEVEITLASGNVLTPIVDKEMIVKPQLG